MTAIRILVLTEDSASEATNIVMAVADKLLWLLADGHQRVEITFEPTPDAVRAMVSANAWKSTRHEGGAKRRDLIRHLTTRVAMSGASWVVWHVDADRPWTEEEGRSENVAEMDRLLGDVDASLASGRGRKGNRDRASTTRRSRDAVLRLIPHYSIESWLYLNRTAVERISRRQPEARRALKWIDRHLDSKTGLDHVERPKHHCPLQAKYNANLVEDPRWPAKSAVAQSPSCRATLDAWRDNAGLVAAIVHADEQGQSE